MGLDTEVVGWCFPNCESLASRVDRCRSYNMYNVSTLYDHLNPAAPSATVLNIWPYQMPTGLLKRPMAVWLHSAELEAIIRGASVPAPSPVLQWVHLNVPHVPWLRDTRPLAMRAFEQTKERYVCHLAEVDRALETVLRTLATQPNGPDTTVVVTADHGSRKGHAGDPLHVPLIVWFPGGIRQDITDEVQVTDILKTLVSGACPQPLP